MHIPIRSFREGLGLKDRRRVIAVAVADSDTSADDHARGFPNGHVIRKKQTFNVGGLILDVWVSVVRERP